MPGRRDGRTDAGRRDGRTKGDCAGHRGGVADPARGGRNRVVSPQCGTFCFLAPRY
jgi:hypothetical protein